MKKFSIALTLLLILAIPLVVNASGTLLETIPVSATQSTSVSSTEILDSDHVYLLEASGTYVFGGSARLADAECYHEPEWAAGVWEPFRSDWPPYGVLDLLVDPYPLPNPDPQDPDWGTCDPTDHTYTMCYAGQDAPVSFVISDWWHSGNTMMGDNSGSLSVDIYDLGCVSQWLPPITNADFALQDGTSLPIKFSLCSPGDLSSEISVRIYGSGIDATFTPKYDMDTGEYIVIFHTKDYPELVDGDEYTIEVYNAGCTLDSFSFFLYAKAGRGNSGK